MTKEPLSKSVSISELRQMREEGLTNKEIAARLDVTPTTIARYLGPIEPGWKPKVERRGGLRIQTPQETIDEIRRLYSEGRSINGISERVHVSWETVKKYTRDLGPNRKKKKELVFDTVPAIEEEPIVNEEPVVQEQEGVTTMLKIISQRQSIRMQGAECQYEIELGDGTDSVTILNSDKQEVAVLDADGLSGLIGELSQILVRMKGAAA